MIIRYLDPWGLCSGFRTVGPSGVERRVLNP